jgi:hypothetical protein
MTGHSRALLTPKMIDHLAKLLAMMGSSHDGEVLNAARLAHEFIRRFGLQWRDVLVDPPGEWQAMAHTCRRHAHLLNDRERDFLNNIARLRRQPTDRQLEWLTDIYERLQREAS